MASHCKTLRSFVEKIGFLWEMFSDYWKVRDTRPQPTPWEIKVQPFQFCKNTKNWRILNIKSDVYSGSWQSIALNQIQNYTDIPEIKFCIFQKHQQRIGTQSAQLIPKHQKNAHHKMYIYTGDQFYHLSVCLYIGNKLTVSNGIHWRGKEEIYSEIGCWWWDFLFSQCSWEFFSFFSLDLL